jgi:hypothetical protein
VRSDVVKAPVVVAEVAGSVPGVQAGPYQRRGVRDVVQPGGREHGQPVLFADKLRQHARSAADALDVTVSWRNDVSWRVCGVI